MGGVRITRRWRWWAGSIFGFATASAIGPLVDERPYTAPIFNTVRAIASWPVWAAAWLAVATCAAAAVITRNAWAWRLCLTGCIATAATWVIGIGWEHWGNGRPISVTGLALWCWLLATNLIAATSVHQFEGAP